MRERVKIRALAGLPFCLGKRARSGKGTWHVSALRRGSARYRVALLDTCSEQTSRRASKGLRIEQRSSVACSGVGDRICQIRKHRPGANRAGSAFGQAAACETERGGR
jgi:hypothetical protein